MNKLFPDSPASIDDQLAKLYRRINYERQDRVSPDNFKLRNMREILKRLDDPHLRYPVIHVAGTKGKGSVATMIGRVLSESGRRTGVYTSPHLESIHQRMVVDGEMITDVQLASILQMLEPVVELMDQESTRQGFRHLTFFELTTAAAICFFASQQCDAVVLEVGLGGRLDSTNVCQPAVSVITNISLDHTKQLGGTLDKIAFEKAGIIKPGIPVISGAKDSKAARVIAQIAQERRSPLNVLGQDFDWRPSRNTDQFHWQGIINFERDSELANSDKPTPQPPLDKIDDLGLNMLGDHQRANAAISVAAIQVLNAQGWSISKSDIRSGLNQTRLAGRTEVVSKSPTVILDIAHNVASIKALVETIQNDVAQWATANRRTLILATSRDKDAAGMLQLLMAAFDRIVLTRFQENPRGIPATELGELATAIDRDMKANSLSAAEFCIQSTPDSAWSFVQQDWDSDDLICITGSAFLIAELRNPVMATTKNAGSSQRSNGHLY